MDTLYGNLLQKDSSEVDVVRAEEPSASIDSQQSSALGTVVVIAVTALLPAWFLSLTMHSLAKEFPAC